MRQDKTVARILLILSVAKAALAAPAVVRQRHLELAKAASEKRAPGSDNGATGGDLQPESSSRMPPHDHYTDGTDFWAWLTDPPHSGPPGFEPLWSSAPENHIIATPAPESTTSAQPATEAGRIFSDADKRKIFGVGSAIVGIVVLGVGIQQTIKHSYVSSLSPLSPANI